MEQNNNPQETKSSSKYWLSLDQWRQDPEFLSFAEQEFRSSPLQSEDGKDGWARREFLKLMGASLALTSFGCVRRPAQMIVPYAKKPREIIHGLSNFYASTLVDAGEGFGVVITARDGRPIKIEGNEDHPFNQGGMSARAHSHILSLYDPDRLSGPRKNLQNDKRTNRETIGIKYEALDAAVIAELKKGQVALLLGSSLSPTTQTLVNDFAATYNAKIYNWDALSYDDLVRGQELSYGKGVVPRWRFDQARMIVAVNCDFLGAHLTPTANAKAFSQSRKAGDNMNKLVVFESLMSLTGTNADERFRLPAGGDVTVLMGLAHHLLVNKKISRFASDATALKAVQAFANAESDLGLPAGTLARLADELAQLKGKSLIACGGFEQSATSLAAQIAANLLNSILDNDGSTVDGNRSPVLGVNGTSGDLAALVKALNQGSVKSLIIHGSNPGYAASSSGLIDAIEKANLVVYTGDRMDETAVLADYVAPDHHSLENWGDSEVLPGVYAVQQPTIQPLYDTRAFQDSLLVWAKAGSAPGRVKTSGNWYEYLRQAWRRIYDRNRSNAPANKSFDDFWVDVLHSGVFNTTAGRGGASSRGFNSSALSRVTVPNKVSGYALQLYATVGLKDGSLANVSWLQEFPDPVTKICWDNYLTVSPQDAEREHLKSGSVVVLEVNGQKLKVPVHVQPGQADGVLGLAVGYGRTRVGKVGNGVGQNAFQLVRWDGDRAENSGMAASLSKTKESYSLACVQDHHSMEGRQIVVEQTLAQFNKDPGSNIHRHKMMTMWSEHKYNGNKWGMVIDLNSCTGCGSCVVACQAENNIPAVGKKYVLQGREMHWIRVDRYYVGEPTPFRAGFTSPDWNRIRDVRSLDFISHPPGRGTCGTSECLGQKRDLAVDRYSP